MAALFNAVLNGFKLDLQTVEDSVKVAVAKYEFPYRDGALLEDMGEHARTITFKSYWGASSSAPYAKHFEFLSEFEKRKGELLALTHPELGALQGMIESMVFHRDDRQQLAEVDFVFVLQFTGNANPQPYIDVEEKSEADFQNSTEDQKTAFIAATHAALGAEATGILSQHIDTTQPILPELHGLSSKARAFLIPVDNAVNTYEATLTGIANPATSLLTVIDFTEDLPGRVVGALAKTMERYALLFDASKNLPSRFLTNLGNALDTLKPSNPGGGPNFDATLAGTETMRMMVILAAASRLNLETAYIFSADETNRDAQKVLDATPPFDAAGNYTPPSTVASPIMNVTEVEGCLNLARTATQAAVDASRENSGSLKSMAATLLDHVRTVKLQQRQIVELDVPNPMPIHAVCLKAGLPYNYADRILALNPQIKQPNFCQGVMKVYAPL